MNRTTWGWIGLIVGAQALAWGIGYGASRVATSGGDGPPPITQAENAPKMTIAELKAKLAGDEAKPIVIDVRIPKVYELGHIPEAIVVPLTEMQAWAAKQDAATKARPTVLYCACNAEQSASQGAVMLSKLGFKQVFALKGGWNGWADSGGRIAKAKSNHS